MSKSGARILGSKEPLKIGYVPVLDCAPVVYAHEGGLFAKYDLNVDLQREPSWAQIKDKILEGELDAAHAPATMPFMANLGAEQDQVECISAIVLSLQGTSIALSRQLFEKGVTDPESVGEYVFETWGKRTFTFAVGALWSTENIILQTWLKSGGISADTHVRVVTIPPEQLFPTLKLGYIDGFCSTEPWTAVAVHSGFGVCAATSADIAPLYPEKVLVVRESFALGRASEHERMIAALLEACAFCDQPGNGPRLVQMLSHPRYANAPEEAIRTAMIGPYRFASGQERKMETSIFHRNGANEPTDAKASWLMDKLYSHFEKALNQPRHRHRSPVLKNAFRRDIFERSKELFIKENGKMPVIDDRAASLA